MDTNKNILNENEFSENEYQKLNNIKKDNCFDVPKDYFEKLPYLIQEKINKPANESFIEKIHSFVVKPQFYLSFSVVLSVFIIVFIVFKENNYNKKNNLYAYNLNFEDELYKHLIDNEEIEESVIVDEIVNDTIPTVADSSNFENPPVLDNQNSNDIKPDPNINTIDNQKNDANDNNITPQDILKYIEEDNNIESGGLIDNENMNNIVTQPDTTNIAPK